MERKRGGSLRGLARKVKKIASGGFAHRQTKRLFFFISERRVTGGERAGAREKKKGGEKNRFAG